MQHKTLANLTSDLEAMRGPALVWYGRDRTELGGPVLARWLAKTQNLLSEEFPFGVEHYRIEAPPSWRIFPWFVALRYREVPCASPEEEPDLLITSSEDGLPGQTTVLQTLEPLAMSWPGGVPVGFIDGAAEVMGFPDQLLDSNDFTLSAPVRTGRIPLAIAKDFPAESAYALMLNLLVGGASIVVMEEEFYDRDSIKGLLTQEGLDPSAVESFCA